MKKKWILIAMAALWVLSASSCKQEEEFSAGPTLSPEEILAKRNELLAAEPITEAESAPELPTLTEEDTCYWAAKGSVWHSTAECSYLSRSTDVMSGTVASAKQAGKTRGCSGCTQ